MTSLDKFPAMIGKSLEAICILLLMGILAAGLRPFHSPRNQVWWLAGGHGLKFGGYGTLLNSSTFHVAPKQGNSPCSIEIWLQPIRSASSGTVLAFYTRHAPKKFSTYQFSAGLVFQIAFQGEVQGGRRITFYVHDIFRQEKPVFVAITSDREQTSVFVDGILVKHVVPFPFSSQNLAGQLVFADSPRTGDGWSGVLRGLALFSQVLFPVEVMHHFETWTKDGRPDIGDDDRALAVYLLDVGRGNLVHNQIPSGINLYIPERYWVVDKYFHEPFWMEYRPSWDYCHDILVNIAGFAPLGFMFCAYLSSAGRVKRPTLVTVFMGFGVSLTIEVTQGYLPTRGSGTTDLINNTFGTGVEIWFYHLLSRRDLLVKSWEYLSSRLRLGRS